MNTPAALAAFAGYGVELEYMIVDRDTLSVLPIADELLRQAAGSYVSQVSRGATAWSNELVLHLIELKNAQPTADLGGLPAAFSSEITAMQQALQPMGARLMPGAMHPWMDPASETRLWPHQHADIYQAYHRIFDCHRHGWANLQSMHLNLPFANDDEFSRLHAAIRLLLPIIPALAASSPIVAGRNSGFLDCRMENYRSHEIKVPSLLGQVIPDTVASRAEYEARIFTPMYRDIASYDPHGILRHEWLNSRGVIPRFDRNALEIRVIDMQECPQADLAIAAAIVAVVRALYDARWASLAAQQAMATESLAAILLATIRDAELATIDNAAYLRLLGYAGSRCEGRELWRHLVEATWRDLAQPPAAWDGTLDSIFAQGPLARRILRAVGRDYSHAQLHSVYLELCNCLQGGHMFAG